MIIIKRQLPIGFLVNSTAKLPIYTDLSTTNQFRLFVFEPANIDWQTNTAHGLLLNRGHWFWKRRQLPKVIYNRIYPESKLVNSKLQQLPDQIILFNQVTQFDKWQVYQSLQTNQLVKQHLPASYPYDPEHLPDLINKHHKLILKPKKSHQGVGIWRLELLENESYALYRDLEFPAILPNNPLTLALVNLIIDPELYLIQEYLDFQTIDGQHFDVRILVQKNQKGQWEVTAALSRIAKSNYFITNISDRSVKGFTLLQRLNLPALAIMTNIEQISKETAQTLEKDFGHLGEISVDFGLDQQAKPWIIEVNGKPNKELFNEILPTKTISKIYLQPILYGQYLNSLSH